MLGLVAFRDGFRQQRCNLVTIGADANDARIAEERNSFEIVEQE